MIYYGNFCLVYYKSWKNHKNMTSYSQPVTPPTPNVTPITSPMTQPTPQQIIPMTLIHQTLYNIIVGKVDNFEIVMKYVYCSNAPEQDIITVTTLRELFEILLHVTRCDHVLNNKLRIMGDKCFQKLDDEQITDLETFVTKNMSKFIVTITCNNVLITDGPYFFFNK